MNKDETQVRNYGWPFRKRADEPKTVRDKHGYILADCQTVEDADYILLALNLQPAPAMPVGEAGKMPGTDGFTMACFHAEDVPVGTKLYAAPPQDEDLLPHLRQFMHNDGSGFVSGYDRPGVDRLVSFLRAKATPAVPDANVIEAWRQMTLFRHGEVSFPGHMFDVLAQFVAPMIAGPTDAVRTAVLQDLKERLELGPNDEAAIGAYETLAWLNGNKPQEVVATGRVKHGGYGMELSTYVAYVQPPINAVFETVDTRPFGATATTEAKIKRVEKQDDGSVTVVIDHWPKSAQARRFDEQMFRTMVSTWAHGFPSGSEDDAVLARKEECWKSIINYVTAAQAPAEPEGHYCGTCEQTVDNRCGDLYCQGPR